MIELTPEDLIDAATHAMLQIIRKIARDRNTDHGGVSNRGMRLRIADGIHGMLGEIALSRMRDQAWTSGGMHITRGDVSHKFEVRATEHLNGHLLIYRTDNDNDLFALMIGHYPRMEFAGWMYAREAKRRTDWWNETADPPCWWVPRSAVHRTIEEADTGPLSTTAGPKPSVPGSAMDSSARSTATSSTTVTAASRQASDTA